MGDFKLELGQSVKEKVTGFTGIITGRAQYITGCNQYCIQPASEKGDKYPDAHWSDEGRLEKTEGKFIDPSELTGDEDGCDSPHPTKS